MEMEIPLDDGTPPERTSGNVMIILRFSIYFESLDWHIEWVNVPNCQFYVNFIKINP